MSVTFNCPKMKNKANIEMEGAKVPGKGLATDAILTDTKKARVIVGNTKEG